MMKRKERRIDCYKSSHKILLVGEGDFSFSACLARAFDSVVYKHSTSVSHLDQLERLGGLLLYKVDVHKMHIHPILKKMKFDVIIFNFPHAGHFCLSENNSDLIQMHRDLVGAYFRSASKMLNEGGEVHIRHRDDNPCNRWNATLLAGEAGLKLKEKIDFQKSDFPGYHNKRGGDIRTNKTFRIVHAFPFKFALDLPKVDGCLPKKCEIYDHDYNLPNKDGLLHDDLDVQVVEMKNHVQEEHTKNGGDDDDDDDDDELMMMVFQRWMKVKVIF